MKKISVITICLLFIGIAFSQPIDSARFRLEFTPKIQNFHKISQPAVIPEETPELPEVEYEIVPQTIDLTFSPTPIKPLKLPEEVMKKLYRNFLKVGFGYPLTPLGELCIHNFDNSKFSYGLNVNHISGWARPIGEKMKNFAYAPFSDTRTHLFLNTFFKNQTLYTSVDYNHKVAHLYGFDKRYGFPAILYDKSERYNLKNNFHHVGAEIGLRSNYVPEDAKLKQDVRLSYDFVTTYQANKENHIGIVSNFVYDIVFKQLNGLLRPQLDINFDNYIHNWSNTQTILDSWPNFTRYSLQTEFIPSAKFSVREYYIRLGIGIPIIKSFRTYYPQDRVQCPVFPVAEVQLGLVPGILSIYAGVDGNTKYNSLKDLLYENPFLKTGQDSLHFTKTQLSVFGGVKGNLVKKLNYHISTRFSNTKDMVFFFLDTASRLKNQFNVVYADLQLLNVCANLNWQVVDKIYLNLEGNYWGYFNLANIEVPWYKPEWEVAFSGKYYLKKKFIFDLNMKMGFGSYALVQYLDAENNLFYQTEKMNPVLNFGVGFEYLVSKRFSCFATVNNIGFQHFAKYYGFNNLGFNAIAGVTYSFGDESLKKAKK
ncbi:MAG: hypothetical protein LBI45_01490 [Bacteroidales bacterium]|nr:hypothetical protein [Bacteroidales bacterium]